MFFGILLTFCDELDSFLQLEIGFIEVVRLSTITNNIRGMGVSFLEKKLLGKIFITLLIVIPGHQKFDR